MPPKYNQILIRFDTPSACGGEVHFWRTLLILHAFKYLIETEMMFFKHLPNIVTIPIGAKDFRAIVFSQYCQRFFVGIRIFRQICLLKDNCEYRRI